MLWGELCPKTGRGDSVFSHDGDASLLTQEQEAIAGQLLGSNQLPASAPNELFLGFGRRSGKTRFEAIADVHVWAESYQQLLAPGEFSQPRSPTSRPSASRACTLRVSRCLPRASDAPAVTACRWRSSTKHRSCEMKSFAPAPAIPLGRGPGSAPRYIQTASPEEVSRAADSKVTYAERHWPHGGPSLVRGVRRYVRRISYRVRHPCGAPVEHEKPKQAVLAGLRTFKCMKSMVGVTGFEPATPTSRT
jgi:hypothetical protein